MQPSQPKKQLNRCIYIPTQQKYRKLHSQNDNFPFQRGLLKNTIKFHANTLKKALQKNQQQFSSYYGSISNLRQVGNNVQQINYTYRNTPNLQQLKILFGQQGELDSQLSKRNRINARVLYEYYKKQENQLIINSPRITRKLTYKIAISDYRARLKNPQLCIRLELPNPDQDAQNSV